MFHVKHLEESGVLTQDNVSRETNQPRYCDIFRETFYK